MDVDKLVPEAGDLAGFIEQFGVFSSAPGGVDRLRELIFQLGVTGQLTVSVDSDDSTESLLKNINERKLKLVKDKKIKKSKTLFPSVKCKKEYEIHHSWRWELLGDICEMLVDGSHNPPRNSGEGIPMLSGKNVRDGDITLDATRYVTENDYLKELERNPVQGGDVFLSIVGSIGRSAVVPNDFPRVALQRSIAQIRSLLDPHYLSLYLRSPVSMDYYLVNAKGTAQKGIYLNQLSRLPVAVPPLEEQKRIVAKVDGLMALCDKLEAQQQQQAHNVLRANTAAINALLNPEPQQSATSQKTSTTVSASESKASFEQNWQRIAQHFNTLYGCTLPMPKGEGRKKKHLVGLENVKALRKVILELAITGQLTTNNKNIGLTDKELEKVIRDRKEWFDKEVEEYQEKEGKKPKKPLLNRKKIEFNQIKLPLSWTWCFFEDLAGPCNYPLKAGPFGSALKKEFYVEKGYKIYGQEQVIANDPFIGNYYIDKTKFDQLNSCEVAPGDILISLVGTVGRVLVLPEGIETGIINPRLIKLSLTKKVDRSYIQYYFQSPMLLNFISDNCQGSTMNIINLKILKQVPIPLPPLEEQKRIIAKVKQLMTLCDQLEQQLTQSYSDAEKLMHATVKALVA